MKISIIIPSFYPAVVYGGWVFSSINTCRELGKHGIQSYVSTTNDNGSKNLNSNYKNFVKLEDNIFVKYYPQTVKERFSLTMLLHLWKDIKNSDAVHIQGIFSFPTPIGLLFSKLLKKKVLISPHGCLGKWCLADGSKFKRLYLLLFIKPFANGILWHATSHQEMLEINELYPKANVTIVPNGINIEDFNHSKQLNKEEFVKKFIHKDLIVDKIIISMSRLHKKKGLDILIRSFKNFLLQYPNAILLMAGEDFGEKRNLENLIIELNLQQKAFFVGHIEGQDRIDFFANADLFVLPSHNENFGMVYAEAMASGTPIIASTNTPWQEVEKYQIGKWVKNDPILTSEAMEEIFKDDLNHLGKLSKEFIEEKYSWKSIGEKFSKIFLNLTEPKK